MNIEEYFGTLLQSVTEGHKKHLMTGKYSNHKALNEFYDEMPDLVDALIEHYQGTHGKVEEYKNTIDAEGTAVEYLEKLLEFTKNGQKELFSDDSALSSDIDSIIGQISSTLYQLKELKESRYVSLRDYLMESLNESFNIPTWTVGAMKDILDCKTEDDIIKFYEDSGIDYSILDTKEIIKSIQKLNKEIVWKIVDADDRLIDDYSSDVISKGTVEHELGIRNSKYWVIYKTDGDKDMLIMQGSTKSAEKLLKDFVNQSDPDTIIVYSWK